VALFYRFAARIDHRQHSLKRGNDAWEKAELSCTPESVSHP
jgi:hypothetical protein